MLQDHPNVHGLRRSLVAPVSALFVAAGCLLCFSAFAQGPGDGAEGPERIEAGDVDASVATVDVEPATCAFSFKLSKRKLLMGRGNGCGVVTCSDEPAMSVALRLSDFGIFEVKTIKGEGEFSPAPDDKNVFGRYRGGGGSADVGLGVERSSWTNEAKDVKLTLRARGRGLGVNVGRGTLHVEPMPDGETCEI